MSDTATKPQFIEEMRSIADKGDRTAFAEIFSYFAPRVKAYMRRLGAEDGQAEELAQETLLTVWRRAGQFDPRQASLSTWIFTIARNRRIDVLRRENRPEIDPDDPALVRDDEPQPDENYSAEQRSSRLRKAVAQLPEEQAVLLQLNFFQELSHAAIAEQMDLPLGTVKSRLRLAMARLRDLLEELE